MFISKYMIASQVSRLFSSINLRIHHTFTQLPYSKMKKERKSMISNRERAVWACQIIKVIKDTQPDNKRDIYQPSLRDQILNLDIQNFTFSQQNRNSIINMFKKGIILNSNIFRQDQILQGKEQQQIIINKNKPKIKTIDQYFIFCPNMLVTKPMFEYIHQSSGNIMIYGSQGITKTISMVLYYHLSSIVNKYLYSAFSDSQEQPFLEQLTTKGLIFQVPKFFYWSLALRGKNKAPLESTLINILLQQATELSKDEKNRLQLPQFQSLEALGFELHRLYKVKNIETKVAFDQINLAASLMRKWNLSYNLSQLQKYHHEFEIKQLQIKLQQAKQSSQKIKIKLQIQKKFEQFYSWKSNTRKKLQDKQKMFLVPSNALLQLMTSFMEAGEFQLYNSSMNIEKYLLAMNSGNGRYITLNLSGHDKVHEKQIFFSDGLSEQWGQNDFKHYFWFEIQKRLVAKGFTQQRLKTFKTLLYDKIKDQKIHKYFRFLNIRQSFQNKQYFFKFPVKTQKFSDQDMDVRFSQIIEHFKLFSLESCLQKIVLFLDKLQIQNKQIMKKFIVILHKLAMKQIKQGKENTSMQLKLDEIDKIFFQQNMGTTLKLLNSEANDKVFRHFQINSNGSIAFLRWTPEEYLQISQIIQIQQKYSYIQPKILFSTYLSEKKEAGFAFQNAMIKLLQTPTTKIQMKYSILQKKIISQLFTINNSTDFLKFHYNQNNSQNTDNYWINFSKMLVLSKKNPNKQIFGKPYEVKYMINNKKQKYKSFTFYPKNPSVDFAIASYQPSNEQKKNHFKITSFDTTVTLDQKTIDKKTQKARGCFSSLSISQFQKVQLTELEKEQYLNNNPQYKQMMDTDISLTHYIICRESIALKRKKQIHKNFTINFIPIESINVLSCPNYQYIQIFKYCREIALEIENNRYASQKSSNRSSN